MNTLWHLINLLVFTQFVACRDFYLGMFRRNDFLVAQDVIYKAPAASGFTTAVYGRLFKCPITYFRVVDRLGQGRGPITTIIRGGLRKKFISVRIKSTYKHPISVNIYVGCENKQPSTFKTTRRFTISTISTTSSAGKDAAESTTVDDVGSDTNSSKGGATVTDSGLGDATGDGTGGDTEDGTTEPGGDTEDGAAKPGGDTEDGAAKPGGDTEDGKAEPGGDTEDGKAEPGGNTEDGAAEPGGDTEDGKTEPGGDAENGTTEPGGDAEDGATEPVDADDTTEPGD